MEQYEVKITEPAQRQLQEIVRYYLVYFWVNEEQKQVQITAVVYGRRDQRTALQNMKM